MDQDDDDQTTKTRTTQTTQTTKTKTTQTTKTKATKTKTTKTKTTQTAKTRMTQTTKTKATRTTAMEARCEYQIDAGGGTRTPDTRIMIPTRRVAKVPANRYFRGFCCLGMRTNV